MPKANLVKRLIAAGIMVLLAGAAIVFLHRLKPLTAPSLKVVLVACTNVSMKTASNNPALFLSPLSNPPTRKDAEFKVFNRGDRPVKIEKGIMIEQRPAGVPVDNMNFLFQTNLV